VIKLSTSTQASKGFARLTSCLQTTPQVLKFWEAGAGMEEMGIKLQTHGAVLRSPPADPTR